MRQVYASTMDHSALEYRARRGLDRRDEQMAILVQRVSGSYWGRYFMPCAAGVGYSFSPSKFLNDIDSSAGMLRLVMGLGTSAVDRTEGSYPRLVSLNKPEATNFTTVAEKHQFSQRRLEVVNKEKKGLEQLTLEQIEGKLPRFLGNTLLEHDFEVEQRLREEYPGLSVTQKRVTTKGDRILDVPLAKIGGKGLFTKELEEEMLSGDIDLAVHSLKDMPMEEAWLMQEKK